MDSPVKKRKLMAEINVVPYIDVMLVLLVIFMVTAPLLIQGIEVDLPDAAAEAMPRESDRPPLVLSVDAEGNVYLNVGNDEDQPKGGDEIVTLVSAVLNQQPETPVYVKADKAVPYGYVVGAMVLLQRSGAEGVGFVTDPLDSYPIPE